MTISATEAYDAMRAHHKALSEELSGRADAVSRAAAAGLPHGAAVAAVVAYLTAEVLPHAAAEEKTIYPVAAARVSLAALVGEMVAEHVVLSTAAGRLAAAASAAAAAGQAQQIAALFAAHAAKENDMLLPTLVADQSVDLPGLLGQMHQHGAAGQDECHDHAPAASQAGPAQADDAQASTGQADDAQAAVLSLLLQAAAALARAGEADRACRIAAAAWAALHPVRPDLAAKVTAALHGLTRRVGTPDQGEGADESKVTPVGAPVLAGPDLDVRDLPPAQRHATIFGACHALLPGAGFVLVNDHDPRPLRYQLEAEHPGEFTWDYRQSGPDVWQVRIGRPAATEPELDVREVSHAHRHARIFDAYRTLHPGAGFVLVNDHDPRPLRYQFEVQYPGEHTWKYLESGPRVWRVRIGRAA